MNYPDFSKILFLDIETVSQEKEFDLLSEQMQKLWAKKAEQLKRDDNDLSPADVSTRLSEHISDYDSTVLDFSMAIVSA